jgi:hypothetical protein
MPRATAKSSADIDACGLSLEELQELWLGPHPTTGSCFCSREELVAAWAAGRDVVMRLWGSHGRRPAGFYEFEYDGQRPAYAVERSTLWRANVLSEAERAELEREWKVEFAKAQAPGFMVSVSDSQILKGAAARERHFRWADIPSTLVEQWSAEHPVRRRGRKRTESALPGSEVPLSEVR